MKHFTKDKGLWIILIFALILNALFLPTTLVKANTLTYQLVETTLDLTNVKDFIISGSDKFIVKNTEVISSINNNDYVLNNVGALNGEIFNPSCVSSLYNQKVAIADELRIQIFTNTLSFIKSFDIINNEILNSFFKIGNIIDMSSDYLGNVYALDKTNNLIVMLNENNTYLKIFKTLNSPLDENSKIAVSPSGNYIAVSYNNIIEVYNSEGNIQATISETCNDLQFDCSNKLYLFLKETNSTTVKSYSLNTFNELITFNSTYNLCTLEVETGKIYFINTQLYELNCENFTTNSTNINSPINIATSPALNEQAKVIYFNAETQFYVTPFEFSRFTNIPAKSYFLLLSENVIENSNLFYCSVLIDNNEVFGYVKKQNAIIFNAELINETYFSICKNVDVFTFPTANSNKFKILNTNNTVLVLNVCAYNDSTYYTVKIDDEIGYIKTNYLAKQGNFESEPVEITDVNTNENQAIALCLILFCLLLSVVTIIVIVCRKNKSN